ncbi:MAG: PQQ-binding-like beta-propeller repeat protein [Verrucomicrobiales bacterium]|nr:PQQ-binding-like beta-propeller repeat protein [Verrucomicrobiales bacterium]
MNRVFWIGAALWLSLSSAAAEDVGWTEFRGPTGQGIANSTRLPLEWSETNNVVWKTPIHGKAWSSPVVLDDQVWLTTATEDGTELSVLRVDAKTGRVTLDKKLFEVEEPQFAHKFNSYASPTPVIEPGRVYVTFGSPGTACLDTATGEALWTRRDLPCNHFRGAGSSPILWRDLFLLHYDGSDHQYVVALDKHTGRTFWKTDRTVDFGDLDDQGRVTLEGDLRKAFSTPLVIELAGRPALLSLGSRALYLYEPATGREAWQVRYENCFSGTCRPLYAGGLAIIGWGFSRGEVSALKVAEAGWDHPPETAWTLARNAPSKPSPVIVGDLIFLVDDGGVGSCLEWRTGETVWRKRIGGNYSASLLAAGDRVYVFNEEGETRVVRAAREFELLATNTLEDGFMASPAVDGDALIVRTKTGLYRIEVVP